MTLRNCYTRKIFCGHVLILYHSKLWIRMATSDEVKQSQEKAWTDGGVGLIQVEVSEEDYNRKIVDGF